MNKVNSQFSSIEQVTDQYLQNEKVQTSSKEFDVSFSDILEGKLIEAKELKFSKHASMRLSSRNIELSDNQSMRLEEGVEKADAKGIRESLVLVDSLAFIVNIPNRTVVTAMEQNETDENIFTNIDGAVIM